MINKYYIMDRSGRVRAKASTLSVAKKKASTLAKKTKSLAFVGSYKTGKVIYNVGTKFK